MTTPFCSIVRLWLFILSDYQTERGCQAAPIRTSRRHSRTGEAGHDRLAVSVERFHHSGTICAPLISIWRQQSYLKEQTYGTPSPCCVDRCPPGGGRTKKDRPHACLACQRTGGAGASVHAWRPSHR